MGRRREGLSVAREIDGLEEKLARCRQSMEEVDLKLRREKLSPEGRKSLERERNLLMTKADNYESDLSLKSCRPQQNECPGSDLFHTYPSGAQGNPQSATLKGGHICT
ncbi:coiled-coil domain-containing protein 167 isoform 1-T1 [Chlamydotis macqueenii]